MFILDLIKVMMWRIKFDFEDTVKPDMQLLG